LQETIRNVVDKINSMSLVHQKLYEANNLSQINLKEYIEDFSKHLMHSYKIHPEQVNLKLDLENVKVSIDSAIPLGLVLTELISNALKHAFPNKMKGEIVIKLYTDKDEWINI